MKINEVITSVIGPSIKPKDLEEYKREVRRLWGDKVIIKQLGKEDGDPRDFWVAKTREDWEKYPHDASGKVATFVTHNGHLVVDLSSIYSPEEVKHNEEYFASLRRQNQKREKADRKSAAKIKTPFFKGQRVKLIPFEDNPEEEGEVTKVLKVDQMRWVVLDDKYIDKDNPEDDGLREVPFDQVVPLIKKPGTK